MGIESIKAIDFIYVNPKWLEKEKKTTKTYFGVLLTILVPVLLGLYVAYLIYSNNAKPDIKDNAFYWLDYQENVKYTPVWNPDVVDTTVTPQIIQVNSIGNANICQKTMPTLSGLGYLPMCPYDNDNSNVPNGIGFGVKLKSNVLNVGYNEASGVGVQGVVETVIATETDLYIIGSFGMAGNRPTTNVASYNINTGKFGILAAQPPQNAGPPGSPTAGLIYNGYLYVAGNGLNVIDTVTGLNGIARMNLQTLVWEKIGAGIPTPYGFTKFIIYQSKLYIACTTSAQPGTTTFFTLVPGQTTFTQVSINGFNQNTIVTAMQTFQTELYIASVAQNGAYLYKMTSQNQATQVYTFPQQNVQSLDAAKRINAMAVVTTPTSSTLFFGGNIPGITGSPTNFIAGWTGTAMCSDMSICPALNLDLEAVTDPSINAIAYFTRIDINNPVLYAAGKFSAINGQSAYSIAQYDTNTKRWIKLKDGGVKQDTVIPATVKSIAYNSKMMYFGGSFKRTATSHANDLLNSIGAYDGFNYIQQVGTSTSNFVSTINAPFNADTELVKFYLFQANVGTPFSIKLSEVLMNPTTSASAGANYISVKAFNTFAIGENSYKYKDDYGTIRKGNDNSKLLYAVGVGGTSGIISDCADSQYGFVGYDNTGLSFTCCYDPATNTASQPNGVPSSFSACTSSAIPDNIPIVTSINAPVWMKKNKQYSKIADRPSEFAMFLIKTESFYSYTTISSGKDSGLTIVGAVAGVLSSLVVLFQFFKRQAYLFDDSVEHGPKHVIYSTSPVDPDNPTGNTPKASQTQVQMV